MISSSETINPLAYLPPNVIPLSRERRIINSVPINVLHRRRTAGCKRLDVVELQKRGLAAAAGCSDERAASVMLTSTTLSFGRSGCAV